MRFYPPKPPFSGLSSTKSGVLCAFTSKSFPIMVFMSSLASSFFPMALCHGCASHKVLRHGAPASNKPHPAEKSTPVWLAIWHIWAGFANSQLLRAAFRCIYLYRYAHSSCSHLGLLLKQTQIFRPICTDCLRHLRISAR